MKKIILSIFVICGLAANAQDSKDELIKNTTITASNDTVQGWKKGGVITLNFSNVGLQNWAAGGSNSMSFTGLTGLYANYTKGKTSWDNSLDLGLGSIMQFAPNAKEDDKRWVKSDDKLSFTSKYGRKASEKWYYSGLLDFKTQFLNGYADPLAHQDSLVTISNFLAPAFAIVAIGMDYKPNKTFSAFIAPVTGKLTIVNDKLLSDAGAFGVDSGATSRIEVGAYIKIKYVKDIVKNVTFNSTLELFQNYETLGKIDVNWETLTSMKVNDYISATFMTHLIYDDDIEIAQDTNDDGITDKLSPEIQFKHVLGVGLTYKF